MGDGPLRALSQAVPLDLPSVTPEELRRANQIADSVNSPKPPKFLDTVWAFKAIDVAHRQGKPLEAEIRKASPFRQTIVVELAHGPTTYIPDERAFFQGNYEVVSSRATVGSGERMVNTAKVVPEKVWRNR